LEQSAVFALEGELGSAIAFPSGSDSEIIARNLLRPGLGLKSGGYHDGSVAGRAGNTAPLIPDDD